MHLVIAYVRPEKLNAIKQELFLQGVLKISVTNALGCGDEPKVHENYRGVGAEVDLFKKLRVEIVVNEDYLERCINAIQEGAKTGAVGDGKIFVLPIAECVRIRTGERGTAAVG